MTKRWYKSKSVWSALLKALSGLLMSVTFVLSGEVAFVDFLPGAVAIIWGAVDVVIRFKTKQGVTL